MPRQYLVFLFGFAYACTRIIDDYVGRPYGNCPEYLVLVALFISLLSNVFVCAALMECILFSHANVPRFAWYLQYYSVANARRLLHHTANDLVFLRRHARSIDGMAHLLFFCKHGSRHFFWYTFP